MVRFLWGVGTPVAYGLSGFRRPFTRTEKVELQTFVYVFERKRFVKTFQILIPLFLFQQGHLVCQGLVNLWGNPLATQCTYTWHIAKKIIL